MQTKEKFQENSRKEKKCNQCHSEVVTAAFFFENPFKQAQSVLRGEIPLGCFLNRPYDSHFLRQVILKALGQNVFHES